MKKIKSSMGDILNLAKEGGKILRKACNFLRIYSGLAVDVVKLNECIKIHGSILKSV